MVDQCIGEGESRCRERRNREGRKEGERRGE